MPIGREEREREKQEERAQTSKEQSGEGTTKTGRHENEGTTKTGVQTWDPGKKPNDEELELPGL